MYLLDTNVISELRKKTKANDGVRAFYSQVAIDKKQVRGQSPFACVCGNEARSGAGIARQMERQAWSHYQAPRAIEKLKPPLIALNACLILQTVPPQETSGTPFILALTP